ncbi:MAG: DUF554 domain-containing protein [Lachnospiraceae bacterium]|nr:DUF554 domain-containing protein [Lachnospiraceae bacterium]
MAIGAIVNILTVVAGRDFGGGGFLPMATGLRMAEIRDFPVADMLPAMAFAMPSSALGTGWVMPLL